MKTGDEIIAYYRSLRDHSGSDIDTYAQTLETFLMHARFNHEVDAFYALLVKAEQLNKQIDHIEPPGHILYDDYRVSDIILVDKK